MTFVKRVADLDPDVPCNGCTACCHNELVPIVPEDGDPSQWITMDGPNGERFLMLKGPDRACWYLGKGGCTIYERRPTVCRVFDCRGIVKMLGRLEAMKQAAAGDPVIKAGIERIPAIERW